MKKIIVYLLGALLFPGCVAEKSGGDCEVQGRLEFQYTYNVEGDDRLMESVHQIQLYAFDQTTGLLVDILGMNEADIRRGYVSIGGLPDGLYTFVAWGASSTDIRQSFTDISLVDPATHTYTGAKIGETTLDNFYMLVNNKPVPDEADGDITPTFDFMRNTNKLHVNVSGLEDFRQATRANGDTAPPVNIFLTGRNGRYTHDNSIDRLARVVRYEPSYNSVTRTGMDIEIKTLRLDKERHAADPVLLHVEDAATGKDIIEPLDVIGMLLASRTRYAGAYGDQEWLDRTYEFPINISLSAQLPNPVQPTLTVTNPHEGTVWPADPAAERTFLVTANCDWSVSVTEGGGHFTASGNGSGNGSFTVATTGTNTSPTDFNSGTVTITYGPADNMKTTTVKVMQLPRDEEPVLTLLDPDEGTVWPADPTSRRTFVVMANCDWSVAMSEGGEWFTTSGSGKGNGYFNVSTTSVNTQSTARQGTITITYGPAGNKKTITATVTQKEAEPRLTVINPDEGTVWPADPVSERTFTVTANCDWSVAMSEGGDHFTAVGSGKNNGSFTVSTRGANTSPAGTNQGTVTITYGPRENPRTMTVNVTQLPRNAEPYLMLTYPDEGNVWPAGSVSTRTFGVMSNCDWSVSVTGGDDWFTVSERGGKNNGNGWFSVSPKGANTRNITRTGTITITYGPDGNKKTITATVAQRGEEPYLTLRYPDEGTVWPADPASTRTFFVESNCDWSVEMTEGGGHFTASEGGRNNGSFTVSTTGTNTSRTDLNQGTVTITYGPADNRQKVTVRVTQLPRNEEPSLTLRYPDEGAVWPAGSTSRRTFIVTANCEWSVKMTGGGDHFTVSGDGKGNGNGWFTVLPESANTQSTARQGTITITYGPQGSEKTMTATVTQQPYDNTTPPGGNGNGGNGNGNGGTDGKTNIYITIEINNWKITYITQRS